MANGAVLVLGVLAAIQLLLLLCGTLQVQVVEGARSRPSSADRHILSGGRQQLRLLDVDDDAAMINASVSVDAPGCRNMSTVPSDGSLQHGAAAQMRRDGDATCEEEDRALAEMSTAYIRERLRGSMSAESERAMINDRRQLMANGYHHVAHGKVTTAPSREGLYFVETVVGDGRALNNLIVDTASDMTWLQCLPCLQPCFQQDRGPQGPMAIFDPATSRSFWAVTCPSDPCTWAHDKEGIHCTDTECTYNVFFAYDKEFSSGTLATDRVEMDSTILMGTLPNFLFGCSHAASVGAGHHGIASGTLGLGAGPVSVVQQLQTALYYCLPHADKVNNIGFLGLGRHPVPAQNTVRTTLLRSNVHKSYYYIPLTAISIGGEHIPIPPLRVPDDRIGGAFLDTRALYTAFPDDIYVKVRDAYRAAAEATGRFPVRVGDDVLELCYTHLPDNIAEQEMPRLTLHFDESPPPNNMLLLPSENILRVRLDGSFCLGIVPSGFVSGEQQSMLSGSLLATYLVTVDPAQSAVTFTPAVCVN